MATWKYRNSNQRCSMKKGILEILQNSQENNCARVFFLIKLQAQTCNFIEKETLTQVFSYEVCKISKNTFLTKHIWATASAHVMNLLLFFILESVTMIFVLICCKNMTIIFSKSVSNSLFVQIVSYCIGKKHLNKYFIQQCQIICFDT